MKPWLAGPGTRVAFGDDSEVGQDLSSYPDCVKMNELVQEHVAKALDNNTDTDV